jgi:prevent-host-death family protein
MAEIGLRELKERASEIVRQVREHGERYVVTLRGRPAALLIPLEEPHGPGAAPESGAQAWADLKRLGEEISQGWQSPQTSTDLLSGMRR